MGGSTLAKPVVASNPAAPHNPVLERWRNTTAARYSIRRFDVIGQEVSEVVGPNREFSLTTVERHRCQERWQNADWFTDGTFAPVELPDDLPEDERALLVGNPNVLDDKAIVAMVGRSKTALTELLADISSPQTLQRIRDTAIAQDVKLSVLAVIDDRLEDVAVGDQPVEVQVASSGGATSDSTGGRRTSQKQAAFKAIKPQ